jgi:hypothetical protein
MSGTYLLSRIFPASCDSTLAIKALFQQELSAASLAARLHETQSCQIFPTSRDSDLAIKAQFQQELSAASLAARLHETQSCQKNCKRKRLKSNAGLSKMLQAVLCRFMAARDAALNSCWNCALIARVESLLVGKIWHSLGHFSFAQPPPVPFSSSRAVGGALRRTAEHPFRKPCGTSGTSRQDYLHNPKCPFRGTIGTYRTDCRVF